MNKRPKPTYPDCFIRIRDGARLIHHVGGHLGSGGTYFFENDTLRPPRPFWHTYLSKDPHFRPCSLSRQEMRRAEAAWVKPLSIDRP